MPRKRMTREEVERKLYERELELEKLKAEIETYHNRAYLLEGEAFGKGYQEAMKQVFELIKEVFGKEKNND